MIYPCALIGYTGFVGSNLVEQHHFDAQYNSKNISEIQGKKFNLVVCAGVSAIKWLANQEPAQDQARIELLKTNLGALQTKYFVLISTIDIYDHPNKVNEDNLPDTTKQDAYGKHRYALEQWVSEHFENYSIIRLPGLFGNYLKKNLIFDLLNPLPKAVNKNLWKNLQLKLNQREIQEIQQYYLKDEFGNMQLFPELDTKSQETLISIFSKANFSTLNFTDSASIFQFYNLSCLWKDIQFAIERKIQLLNIATEPIIAAELVKFIFNQAFNNTTEKGAVFYDMYSKYAANKKYLYTKEEILNDIKKYVEANKK